MRGALVDVAINRDKVLETAQKYVEKKKYDKAVAELKKLVDTDPNDARTLLKIGDLQAKQGFQADAISTYESVGKLYSHQGFALKAIAVYKQIREIIAKHVPHLEERYGHIAPKLAELYQQLGLTSDALAALDEVATRLQRQQRDGEAIDVFRRIVELDPTNPLPHLRLAEALSRAKDIEGAVYEFKTAASQLASIGRRDDALKVLERLLHHKPDAEQARICAELYLSRGQAQDGMQALAKLQICFQANPRDFDTLSLLARAFNAIGQGAKAIEVQKEMARVARDTGKTDLFREILERLMRVAPHDEGVRRLAQAAMESAPPYGAAATNHPRAASMQPHESAYQDDDPPQPQPYGARPSTQPFQRSDANAFDAPQPEPQPHSTMDPVDDLSYSEREREREEEAEELVADDMIEDEGSHAEVSYGEAYVGDVDDYAEPSTEQASSYAEQANSYAEQAYGDPYQHGNLDSRSHAPTGAAEVALDYAGPPVSEVDTAEHVSNALETAHAFRRVRLYAKALATLREGLQHDPRSMDLHEVYRDVLIESGQTEEAVQEMLVIASLYVDALDGESAARALQDVLAFDPSNARAIDMLQELGYEIVDENQADEGQQVDPGYGVPVDEGVHDARLAAYEPHAHYTDDAPLVGYGDREEQLPRFPLESISDAQEQDAYAHAAPDPRYAAGTSLQAYESNEGDFTAPPAFGRPPSMGPEHVSARPPSIGAAASHELEDALDEAEFFCSRGLFDDARSILNEQLAKHPNNPLLRERVAELDALEAQRGSGAREKPREESDRLLDIGTSLDGLESLENLQAAEGHAGDGDQVDVEEVFAKFKEGVAKQISVEDSDSHYNLGIAYKEMLLLDDAIREFDLAALDPKRECVCRSMIGMIQLERGNINEAIEAFLLGLNAPIKDPSQETVLCFEIGAAYEAKKMNKDALSYYQKAMRRDPNYRDVQERVRRLAKAEPKQNLRQAVGADDEFDRAFDDLLSKA